MLTKIAIVGRPNVGKSTLFNRFIGKKKAIVHKTPGTTRDRNDCEVLLRDRKFIITDTAGWSNNVSVFSEGMVRQLCIAIKKADIILFVVDVKIGVHHIDIQIANQIRISQKRTIVVVNKIDVKAEEIKGYEFYELGFDDLVFISANHGRGMDDLLDNIWNNIKYDGNNIKTKNSQEQEILKIILVGKPNVGKSSFINAVAKEERSIVHDIPGTTRDSLAVTVKVNGKEYIVVDTAGLHKGSKMKNDMEYLSKLSTDYAIEDANVAILLVDASDCIGETEVKIARLLVEKKKPVIIVVNKWDLIENKEEVTKYFEEQLRKRMKFMNWVNVVFISTKTGQRLEKVFKESEFVFQQYSKRIPQEEFNEVIRDAVARKPYTSKGRTLKLKEYTQVSSKPPVFSFSVNDMTLIHFSYERFLENCLRTRFGFYGSPIVLKFRKYYRKRVEH
jgi:GTP-binding protein